MTVKLTQKLLENRRRGRKQSITECARKISQKMSITVVGQPDSKAADKSEAEIVDSDAEEGEVESKKQRIDLGPPGFYDEDVAKYYKKFDHTVKERENFKKRMHHKMSFSNKEWNQNVESQASGVGHRRSKQVIKVVNGLHQTLSQLDP